MQRSNSDYISVDYYVAQIGERCPDNFTKIRSVGQCNVAAKKIVQSNVTYSALVTESNKNFAWAKQNFIPGNNHTAGCYWNNGGKSLWFNDYGIEGEGQGTEYKICMSVQGLLKLLMPSNSI